MKSLLHLPPFVCLISRSHYRLAGGPNRLKGARLALSSSLEDAEELCNDEVCKGRTKVAACNSPSNGTVSSDIDAIREIEELLEDENKFFRCLVVDNQYLWSVYSL